MMKTAKWCALVALVLVAGCVNGSPVEPEMLCSEPYAVDGIGPWSATVVACIPADR